MVRNIIFDIGNVLTDFRWKEFLKDKGFDDEMIGRIAKASVESPLWKEFDRGVLDGEDLMQAFIDSDPEIEEELHRAYDDIHGMVTIRDYAIPWVQELKSKGYKVWYLSNFSEKTETECADSIAFIPYMDGGILSWKDKLIKPDPKIYQLLLERFGLVAEESVFIDDLPENVQGAVDQGMHGIVFETREQVVEELKKLGVE